MTTSTTFVLTTPITSARSVVAEPYVIPDGLDHLADALHAAYADGVEAARSAATWTTDGNGDPASYAETLRMLDDGDPAADDRLPNMPDLSGEWADGPTPSSLVDAYLTDDHLTADADVMGEPSDAGELAQVLADAWEAGRDDVWERCVEAELAGALADPAERASSILDASPFCGSDAMADVVSHLADADLSTVERAGLIQAIRLESLRRSGIVVHIGQEVRVEADAGALYRWSKGDGPSNVSTWSCSALAHDALDGLSVSLAANGDLVDLELAGLHYSNQDGLYYVEPLDEDGIGSGSYVELGADELNAFLRDVLADVLPVDHGAWWSNVGRHLDVGDPRVTTAERIVRT